MPHERWEGPKSATIGGAGIYNVAQTWWGGQKAWFFLKEPGAAMCRHVPPCAGV